MDLAASRFASKVIGAAQDQVVFKPPLEIAAGQDDLPILAGECDTNRGR